MTATVDLLDLLRASLWNRALVITCPSYHSRTSVPTSSALTHDDLRPVAKCRAASPTVRAFPLHSYRSRTSSGTHIGDGDVVMLLRPALPNHLHRHRQQQQNSMISQCRSACLTDRCRHPFHSYREWVNWSGLCVTGSRPAATTSTPAATR